ncbi:MULTISPECIES: isochorismate synthase [Corynebacterium]|uniref:isochorismate synthase n=2 Tax=Corynebacterium TaxID=1716 RepID=G0HGD4_CORVD|nr:isochorismate synthase [Corynebacterium variabile]AEK38173.1 Isochorismate synthase [Corynebacterium variabile DSM 44702]
MIFEMSTPGYHLRTSGVRHRITPSDWSGPAVARAVHEALDIARTCSSDATTADGAPLVVGAIPFDTSTPAVLYVPERAQWRDPTTATTADQTIRPTPADAPESFPPPDSPAYRRAVGQAVYEINVGHLDKVVLARRMTVEHAHPVDRDALFAHLAADNPQAFTYRVDLPGSSTFLGASPELVLRCQDGVATSVPLAGSAPRCPVTAPDHELINHRRRRQLLHSPKNLQEHSLVSRRVAEVFRAHAAEVTVPTGPGVVETPVIMHLASTITGRLHEGISPVELAYALHPTPAVCGWPTQQAAALINELESSDRGMYAGLVGWVDAEGNSEWALALRGGLVRDNGASGSTTTAFAGAGIVAGSDPDLEHAETDTKFRTFTRALSRTLAPTTI